MEFALCHPDRPEYALKMCKSCYVQSVRDAEKKRQSDHDYEERHRTERNEQRRLLAAKRREAKRKSTDLQSSESNSD